MKWQQLYQRGILTMGLAISILGTGCLDGVDGVACATNDDCASHMCSDGVCTGGLAGDDTGDTASDSQGSFPEVTVGTDTPVMPNAITGLDFLVVVDNSISMTEEQTILFRSIQSLLGTLKNGVPNVELDVRLAVATTDMGVSVNGVAPNDSHFRDAKCEGNGDGGNFVPYSEYYNEGLQTVNSRICWPSAETPCGINEECVTSIESDNGKCYEMCSGEYGDCTSPFHTCVQSPEKTYGYCVYDEANLPSDDDVSEFITPENHIVPVSNLTGEYDWQGFTTAAGPMMMPGIDGCNYEQTLKSAMAAMNHPGHTDFLRPDALTVILVITDEEDCSIGSEEWHDLPEVTSFDANLACGLHQDLLVRVENLKDQIIAGKTTATGQDASQSVMFAAITGVPPVAECQGVGSTLAGCLDVALEKGTMRNPGIVAREINGNEQRYFESACERYMGETLVTRAYPATRIVQMAQLFGEMGYVYSICNEDWTPMMKDIGNRLAARWVRK